MSVPASLPITTSPPRYTSPLQDEERGLASCLAWLEECGAVTGVDVEGAVFLDCKASSGRLARPADKEAVAHGDANLDIGDFMKGMGM